MRKLLFLILLWPSIVFGQASTSQMTFNTLTDLRGSAGTPNVQVLLNGLASINDGNGGVYMWNSTSTATDDGFITIKPTTVTTGRWVRIGNGNTLKGTAMFGGVSLTTTYTISYPQPFTFTPLTVVTIPRSANAAQLSYVTNITNTSFQVVFLTVPIVGTNNIVFDYIVVKQ
jgi:hypothetical protein